MQEQFYIITPIFNPRKFKSRIRLYHEFAQYVERCGAKLITVEVAFRDREFEVTVPHNKYHLQLRSPYELWHKERAINLGIEHLKKLHPEVRKVAWIDADVAFTNPNWIADTLNALEHYDVVQMFSQATSLGPNHEILWSHESAFKYWLKRKPATVFGDIPLQELSGGHPGLAWAARIDALEKLGGLMDSCIHGCYDEQTEVYTNRGFISFRELTMDDKVLSISGDKNIEWGDVTKLYNYEYDGEMYKIKSDSINLFVTPNHNMFYSKISNDETYFEKIENTNAGRKVTKTGSWAALLPNQFNLFGAKNLDLFVAFMGLWIAEGWTYYSLDHHSRIGISQTKQHNIDKVKELLDDVFPNTKWSILTKHGKQVGFMGNNKPLFTYLEKLGKQKQRYIPTEIKALPTKYLNIFMKWFILGDGSIEKKKNPLHKDTISLYTSSAKLKDDLLELVIKTGKWASVSETIGKLSQPLTDGRQIQSSVDSPFYVIRLQKSKDFYIRPSLISKEQYKGNVYCCETPNHTLLVKRNGKIIWCGNSGDSHMANALRGDVHAYYLYKTAVCAPSAGFNDMLEAWASRCDTHIRRNVGVVEGTCNHYWHGNYDNRGYNVRWDIICHHAFDPATDVRVGDNGLYEFVGNKPDFEQDLRLSMIARNDDDNVIVPNAKDVLRVGDKVGEKTLRRVTEGYLNANPALLEQGVKVGDLWLM